MKDMKSMKEVKSERPWIGDGEPWPVVVMLC
jgi:hypothetical protein